MSFKEFRLQFSQRIQNEYAVRELYNQFVRHRELIKQEVNKELRKYATHTNKKFYLDPMLSASLTATTAQRQPQLEEENRSSRIEKESSKFFSDTEVALLEQNT